MHLDGLRNACTGGILNMGVGFRRNRRPVLYSNLTKCLSIMKSIAWSQQRLYFAYCLNREASITITNLLMVQTVSDGDDNEE